jgi:hypothetical protein
MADELLKVFGCSFHQGSYHKFLWLPAAAISLNGMMFSFCLQLKYELSNGKKGACEEVVTSLSLTAAVSTFMEKFVQIILVACVPRAAYFVEGLCMFMHLKYSLEELHHM